MSALKWKLSLFLVASVALLVAFALFRPQPRQPLEVLREELSLRDGLLHRNKESSPFTGIMIERYPDGTLKSRSFVASGLLQGLSEGWYTNRQLQVSESFKAGVSHGPRMKWYENGKPMSETTIEQGRHHGVFRRWHENGELAEQVNLVDGKPDGLSLAYHPSGYLKARVVLKMGEVLEQKFWEDGKERLAAPGGSP